MTQIANVRDNRSALSLVRSKGDRRLPKPGSVITREYDNKTYRVIVLRNGFMYRGQRYTSLSTIARDITGTIWNGFLFFRLGHESVEKPGPKKAIPRERSSRTSLKKTG